MTSLLNGRRELTKEAALEDISKLTEIIVESHPEPFMHASSQISFYEKIEAIVSRLRGDRISLGDFWVAASEVTALVGDGHTSIDLPDLDSKRLWLEVEPLDSRLIVTGVYEKAASHYIGASVRSVEDISMGTLLERIRNLRGSDGPYSDLRHVVQAFRSGVMTGYLLQKAEVGDSLTLGFEVGGEATFGSFRFAADHPGELVTPKTALGVPPPGPNDMSWTVLSSRDDVAYLRIDSMRKYRENYEHQLIGGASEVFLRELLAGSGFASQGDLMKCIKSVPSASQTILELMSAMKNRGIANLVVDLRNNSGGNSYLVYMLAYFLYGERAIGVDEGYSVTRHSRLAMEQFPGADVRPLAGAYDFADKQRWASGKRGMSREEAKMGMALSPTFQDAARDNEPLNPQRVLVLTSATTYSAGFELAFLLKKLGAIVVGTEPSQPDNAYLDTLRFSLPNSGAKGGVSRKLMLKSPTEPIHHRFKPDLELTYDEYCRFRFDPNSCLLLALGSLPDKRSFPS